MAATNVKVRVLHVKSITSARSAMASADGSSRSVLAKPAAQHTCLVMPNNVHGIDSTALHNQLKLVIGACSNCFRCASHDALHAYVSHKKDLLMWSDSTFTNICMLNSLFAIASEPAISFSRYCNCLLAAFTFRMPSTYCASADARRSVSFVASTAYPSTDSPSCSFFRFAARYTDCNVTLVLCKRCCQAGYQTDVQWACSHLTSSLRSLPTVCL